MQKKSLAKAAVAIVAITAAGAALSHSGASGIVKERMDVMSFDGDGNIVVAGGRLRGWVVGLSIFGTFLSSNTFLGVPGKAFAEDLLRWMGASEATVRTGASASSAATNAAKRFA